MADSPQLPEHTQPPPRSEAPAEPDLIGIPEALRLFDLGDSTLRRKLREGKVSGSRTVSTKRGEEWRFPAESLEALGYRRKGDTGPLEASEGLSRAVEDSLDELREQLRVMRENLSREQRQLEARTDEKARAEVEVGRLQERLKAAEELSEQQLREALSLGWAERRRRRKALRTESGAEN